MVSNAWLKKMSIVSKVIRQIQAVQAALNRISVILLENHLENCILDVVEGENLGERQRSLAEVASIFEMSTKLNYTIEGELHDNIN